MGLFDNYDKGWWRNVYDPMGFGYMGDTKKETAKKNAENDAKSAQAGQENAQAKSTEETGNVADVGSLEDQAATRRLARMSKYFTTPTGVLDNNTGSQGVF